MPKTQDTPEARPVTWQEIDAAPSLDRAADQVAETEATEEDAAD